MSLHLVTGGAGFVGSAIAETLQKSGHKVRVLDIHIPQDPILGVEYLKGDILSKDNLENAMKDVTYVHHSAALVPLHHAKDNFNKVNFEGTRNTFFAAQNAGVKHFCQISSSAVYGLVQSSDCPLKSDFVAQPFEPYGQSKLAADKFLLESNFSNGPTYSILRPRTVVGPGRLGLLQLLFEWIRLGCDVYLPGDGQNKFQLLDVRDLAQASVLASIQQSQGIFLLGSEEFGTLYEDLSKLCQYAGTGAEVRKVHSLLTRALNVFHKLGLSPLSQWHLKAAQHDLYFDLNETKEKLNWQPKYNNQQTLRDAYDWYLVNRAKINSEKASIHQRPLNWGVLALTKFGRRKRRSIENEI